MPGHRDERHVDAALSGLIPPETPMKHPLRLAILAVLAAAPSAFAADWQQLGDNAAMKLSLSPDVRKGSDGASVTQYRLDFKSPQKNAEGKMYQSSTMTVSVSCPTKTVALSEFVVHTSPGGQGPVVMTQKVATPTATKVAAGSSDELVWNAVCAPKPAAAPAPATAPAAAPKSAAPKK
jgi:hypothetical protein